MSALILPSAVAALAHKRLREASDALRDKATAGRFSVHTHAAPIAFRLDNVAFQPTDQRMFALIDRARTVLEGSTKAAMPPDLRIGNGLGSFAVLGTTAFDWPGYAEHFTGDPIWRAGAMRRGAADPNLSQVIVPTTEFALQVGQRARAKTTDAAEQLDIAAFTGGMLASLAADLVMGPVARGIAADVGPRPPGRHGPAAIGDAGRFAMANLLGGAAGATSWQRWWPREHEIPGALYDGYIEALQQTYGFLSTPAGFAPFLESFVAGDDLTAKRLAAGVSFLTQDLVTAHWGAGEWYLVLTPALLSVPVSLLVGRFLAPASGWLAADTSNGATGILQLYSLAAGISAITPFGLAMYLWANVPEHAEAFVTSLVLGLARFVLAPLTVGLANAGETGATWALWALQTSTDLYSLIRGFVALGMGRSADAFVHLFNALPSAFGLLTSVFAAIIDAADVTGDLGFWLFWAILTVLVMVPGGLGWAFGMAGAGGIGALFAPGRDGAFPVVEALAQAAAPTNATARAALFDDSTLWRDPNASPPTAAALTQLRYPTDRQPVVKVWWEGAGNLEIAHDDHTVRLRHDAGAPIVVTLGPGEMTGVAIALRLEEALAGVATSLVDPALDQRLAFPHALADPGDGEPTHAAHDAHAADFAAVGKTEQDAYLLRTAPRSLVATRAGLGAGPGRADQAIRIVPDASLAGLDDTAVGLAADLAAMFVAGAVPSLGGADANAVEPTLAAIPNNVPGAVYQLFRQWNLDERRLNEWRALVTGGAVSDKADPAVHEPGMRPHPNAAAYAPAAPATAEDLLVDMGWIPAWRAWLRVATDVTADTSATTAQPYTPEVERRDGTRGRPTNQQLTDAIRYLFDLP